MMRAMTQVAVPQNETRGKEGVRAGAIHGDLRQANRERNRVIHDTWATRPGSLMVTLHDERRSHDVMVTARTLSDVRQLADQVADAADELRAAMTTALGTGWALIEDQLRQELGHEVRVDPGG